MNSPMQQVVYDDPNTGQRRVYTTGGPVPDGTYTNRWTAQRIINWILGIIEAILALRFIFLALGANDVSFVRFIYSISNPLVAPFRGIFSAPTFGNAQFSSETLLAMVVYALVAWLIVALINAFVKTPYECVGPNCPPSTT